MNDLIYKDEVFKIMRAMIFCLSAWFFVTVSVFAESFPNRPTAGEMDEIVDLGTECVRGVNERCYASQFGPPFSTTGSYLDQNAMGTIASTIRSLVTYYVNSDTVYDGTTNIVMLTVTGLWAKLEIGDHMDQFTCTPGIGTNAATYGDYPWRIYVTSLQERNNVIWAQQKTKPSSYYTWFEKWQGHGCGLTCDEAYNDAVDAYDFVINGVFSGEEIRQHCKISFFSNTVVQVGSGVTNETGTDGTLGWYQVGATTAVSTQVIVYVTTLLSG